MIHKITMWSGISVAYCVIYGLCHKYFLVSDDSKLTSSIILAILLLLIAWLGISVPSIISLKKRLSVKANIKDYLFVENPGHYVHNEDEGAFCQPCLLSGIPARLSKTGKDSWCCRNCNSKIPSSSFGAV